MKLFGRAIGVLPLFAAALLAGCGGGGTNAGVSNQQSSQLVVTELPPVQKPLATGDFIVKAQGVACASTRNRLFVIDQKMVFWDTADYGCADASYSQTLFGATPKELLCSTADSIAGPRTSCADDASRALFDTILKNLDKADLGLGSAHKVEALAFAPRSGVSLSVENVASDAFSGVKIAKNVVVKDAAAWQALWTEHSANRSPAPALPKVDFAKQMLLGVFVGEHANGCRQLEIQRVGVSGATLLVEYDDHDVTTVAVCAAVASSGMQVVAVERSDAAVEFVNTSATAMRFETIDGTNRSMVRDAQDLVIRDAAAWAELWAAHSGGAAPLPAINFDKKMVLAVFLGSRPNGCYATNLQRVYRNGKKIMAVHVDSTPGMGVLCTLQITTPAHLIQVERSDDPVEFAFQEQPIR